MFFHNALTKLKESDVFKIWKKDNPDTILSTGFIVVEKDRDYPWMIGFYDPASDKISSFIVDNYDVAFEKTDEVFKKEEDKVLGIELDKVKVDVEELLEAVEKFRKEKYSHEVVTKTILILQNIEKLGTIWNITLVTQAFNAINMKITVEDCKLIEDSWSSLISYAAG